jgi:hypothetical protein
MFVSYKNLYVEILNPKVMVLRGDIFGRQLGHESTAINNGLNPFIKEILERLLDFTSYEDSKTAVHKLR